MGVAQVLVALVARRPSGPRDWTRGRSPEYYTGGVPAIVAGQVVAGTAPWAVHILIKATDTPPVTFLELDADKLSRGGNKVKYLSGDFHALLLAQVQVVGCEVLEDQAGESTFVRVGTEAVAL